jgi:hypothetical protein
MSAFTPGPWALSDFSRDMIVDSNGDLISLIIDVESDETKLANAHVIAAAPDLLAALQEARNGLLWYQALDCVEVVIGDDRVMKRIDAAITKANGETK